MSIDNILMDICLLFFFYRIGESLPPLPAARAAQPLPLLLRLPKEQ